MQNPQIGIKEVIGIVKRRRTPMILCTAGILLAGSILAFTIPASFRSTATILIEEQEIPSDIVRSAITTYADQRIETIKQQVMSRATLWKIVEQYDLYKSMRNRNPTEEILKRLVKDIQINVINAKVVDKRSQTPTQATIAFTLSYDGDTPELAQKVANELTSLFLAQNLKTRERHAQETTAFLKQEGDQLAKHIEMLEQKIVQVKQRADGALPELTQLNMQLLNGAERELTDADRDIRNLEERKTYLEGELASIKPNTPIMSAAGERILDSGERLKALRAEFADKKGYLSAEHPDIWKMEQEIHALERETGESAPIDEVVKRLTGERATLASLLDRYGDQHPDVIKSRQIIGSLEKDLRQYEMNPTKIPTIKAENPAYINIQAQLNSSTSMLEAMKAQRIKLRKRIDEYARRIEKTHHFEPEYIDLARERDNSARKYEELRSKLLEAQVSEGLETQRKGERFSLIDPPDVPEKPDKPNRPMILLLSVMLALVGGAGSGALLENIDRSIRGPQSLVNITQVFPLAVIPYIPNQSEYKSVIVNRRTIRLAGIGLTAACIIAVHFFWMPLDVIWFTTLRKLGLD